MEASAVFKVASSGVLLWEKWFVNKPLFLRWLDGGMAATGDGGFVAASGLDADPTNGWKTATIFWPRRLVIQRYVFKVDGHGDLVWNNTYGLDNPENEEFYSCAFYWQVD